MKKSWSKSKKIVNKTCIIGIEKERDQWQKSGDEDPEAEIRWCSCWDRGWERRLVQSGGQVKDSPNWWKFWRTENENGVEESEGEKEEAKHVIFLRPLTCTVVALDIFLILFGFMFILYIFPCLTISVSHTAFSSSSWSKTRTAFSKDLGMDGRKWSRKIHNDLINSLKR